jgi:uncharacterized damage-inducible protein DinB
MDPLRTYDYLALARRRVFDRVRHLSAEQYAREFPIGRGTLGRTLTHIMISEWYYVERMQRRDVPEYAQWPIRDENPPPFTELDAAWNEQAVRTRAALGAVRDWTTALEYRVTDDDGRRLIVTASPADIFTQLALHEVHHRAQAMSMLRHLGLPVSDIDFNALMYRRRAADPETSLSPFPSAEVGTVPFRSGAGGEGDSPLRGQSPGPARCPRAGRARA